MFCTKCGTEIKDGFKFCPKCGTQVYLGKGTDMRLQCFSYEMGIRTKIDMDKFNELKELGAARFGYEWISLFTKKIAIVAAIVLMAFGYAPNALAQPTVESIRQGFEFEYSKDLSFVWTLWGQLGRINYAQFYEPTPIERCSSCKIKHYRLKRITNITSTSAKAVAEIETQDFSDGRIDTFDLSLDLILEGSKWHIDDYDDIKKVSRRQLLYLNDFINIVRRGDISYANTLLCSKGFERQRDKWVQGIIEVTFDGHELDISYESMEYDDLFPTAWIEELTMGGYNSEDYHVGMVYGTNYLKNGAPSVTYTYYGGDAHHCNINIENGQRLNSPAPRPAGHDLGYAVYKGKMKNQKFNDVEGKLVFYERHLIDNRDPRRRKAEPGDYVVGEFIDGHLVQGVWYDSNGQRKGSILIGRQ